MKKNNEINNRRKFMLKAVGCSGGAALTGIAGFTPRSSFAQQVSELTTLEILQYDLSSESTVETVGYSHSGDGGSAKWISTGSLNNSKQATKDFVNGFIYDAVGNEFAVDVVSELSAPQYGVFADGSDSFETFPALIACPFDIFFPQGVYKSSAPLYFDNDNKSYRGAGRNNTSIVCEQGERHTISASDNIFTGINFIAEHKNVKNYMIDIVEGANNFMIQDCRVGDIKTTETTNEQYGLRVYANRVSNFNIINTVFENISAMGDQNGVLTHNGFCGGVYFRGDKDSESEYTAPSFGHIRGCQFINIYTEKHPQNTDKVDYDSDGIRISIPRIKGDTTKEWGLNVSDCYFKSVQKSAIKCGKFTNLHVSNIEIVSDRTDVSMIAGVRLQWVRHCSVSNVLLSGNYDFLINLIGQDILVDGINYAPAGDEKVSKAAINFQTHSAIENNHIHVKNVNLKKCAKIIDMSDTRKQDIIDASGGKKVGENITLENIYSDQPINYISYPAVDIRHCKNVNLKNFEFLDPASEYSNVIELRDIQVFDMDGLNIECTRSAINFVENDKDENQITLKNSRFKRKGSGYTGIRLVSFRPRLGGFQKVDQLTVSNVEFYVPSQAYRTNEEPLIVKGDNITLSNLSFYIDSGEDNVPAVGMITMTDCQFFHITNCSLFSQLNPALASSCRVIYVVDNSHGGFVNGVYSEHDGVVIQGTSYNNVVNNVNASVLRIHVKDISSGSNTLGNDLYTDVE